MVTAPSDGCLDFCVTVDVVVGGSEKKSARRVRSGAQPNRTLGRVTTAQPFSPKTFMGLIVVRR